MRSVLIPFLAMIGRLTAADEAGNLSTAVGVRNAENQTLSRYDEGFQYQPGDSAPSGGVFTDAADFSSDQSGWTTVRKMSTLTSVTATTKKKTKKKNVRQTTTEASHFFTFLSGKDDDGDEDDDDDDDDYSEEEEEDDYDNEDDDYADANLKGKRPPFLRRIRRKYLKAHKVLIPLLIVYKLKFFTLVHLLVGALLLLKGTIGIAAFFFALFSAALGLRTRHR